MFITLACYFLYIRYFGLFLVEENTLYLSCLSAAKHLNSSELVIPTEQSDEIRRVRQCRQRMVARSMGNAHAVRVAKRRHCQRISQKLRNKRFFTFVQNDKTTFCYRRVLQQQVKRSTPTPPPVNWHLPSGRGGV